MNLKIPMDCDSLVYYKEGIVQNRLVVRHAFSYSTVRDRLLEANTERLSKHSNHFYFDKYKLNT